MNFVGAFLLATVITLGFCIILHVPKIDIFPTAVIGGLGWLVYQGVMHQFSEPVIACFIASCLVGLLSDICARIFKDPTTIFIIPAVMPLVPGAGMYYTMLALVKGDLELFAETASNTFFLAGAIALGLVVVGSAINAVRGISRKISSD